MRTLLGTLLVAGLATGASALSARADSIIACPLPQATRTIVENLPPGWSTKAQVNGVTNYKVDTSSGQELLVCEYGTSGSVQRPAPVNNDCIKIPGRKFKCVAAPPPGPAVAVVSDGTVTLVDNGQADIDAGGPPDMRLNASNPFLRLIMPANGAKFSPQGTHMPTVNECVSAPYSGAPIQQVQLPVGSWMCVSTSDGNFARVRVAVVNGIPGLPVPMTIYFDHTTWSQSGGGGGSQPVHSDDTIVLQQTFSVDLDEGQISSGSDDDLWFQAISPVQMNLKPMNGAQLAVGNKSDRGYDGCSAEAFSPAAVPLNQVPPGSYVCLATNEGRVSQFRVINLTPGVPKKLTIQYTTWE
jgi:hypothetical protein